MSELEPECYWESYTVHKDGRVVHEEGTKPCVPREPMKQAGELVGMTYTLKIDDFGLREKLLIVFQNGEELEASGYDSYALRRFGISLDQLSESVKQHKHVEIELND